MSFLLFTFEVSYRTARLVFGFIPESVWLSFYVHIIAERYGKGKEKHGVGRYEAAHAIAIHKATRSGLPGAGDHII